jgi:hypothetical protein
MPSFSAQERLRYAFDNFMSKGTWALLGGLGLVSAGLIFAVSLFIMVLGVAPAEEGQPAPGLLSLAWASLMHTLDTGTVGGDSGSGWYIGAMFVATIGGLFTVSTLIGILNNALEEKLDALRKGRSRVIEEGHTVILGWAPQIFPIISELVSANENQRDACIVILADKDKVEMEEALGDKIAELKTTRLVCRSGSPIDIGDLEIASLGSARSIIILGDESEEPDSGVIKTLLAILHNPKRRKEPYHIVAELQEAANLEVAKLISKGEA